MARGDSVKLVRLSSRSSTIISSRKKMVSSRSVEWTCLLVQLVVSGACLLATTAIISAKWQSISVYPDKQYISLEWWSLCALSFLMIWATIFSMIGLSHHRGHFLYPHLLLLIVFSIFIGRVLIRVLMDFDYKESTWVLGASGLILAETFILSSIFFECRTLRAMD